MAYQLLMNPNHCCWDNESATITATVSVDDDAQNDTFFLGLSPYTCFGGWHQKFAVGGLGNKN